MSTTLVIFFQTVFFLLLIGFHVEANPQFRSHALKSHVEFAGDKSHRSPDGHFGYRDFGEWGKINKNCLGTRQSPIDLKASDMARLEVPSPLHWQGYETTPTKMTVENNGHSVQLSATWDDGEVPQISGGVLDGVYEFSQLHFHWGANNNVGSEHTINNHSLPLEMHIVHFKKEYGSISVAQEHGDGLAVVGILFVIDKRQNHGIFEMESQAHGIRIPGSKVEITPFPLTKFNVKFSAEYVSYLGSLTTPTCNEIVTWILSAIPRFVTRQQMNFFRSIHLSNGDDHNYRPTMPLNGRIIYYVSH